MSDPGLIGVVSRQDQAPPAGLRGDSLGWILERRIEELEDLVRWLALPFGENTPLFATATWDGQPLETGKRMAELYAEVVGERSEPPRVGVAWTRCPTCDSFQTIPVEP